MKSSMGPSKPEEERPLKKKGGKTPLHLVVQGGKKKKKKKKKGKRKRRGENERGRGRWV